MVYIGLSKSPTQKLITEAHQLIDGPISETGKERIDSLQFKLWEIRDRYPRKSFMPRELKVLYRKLEQEKEKLEEILKGCS